VVQSQCPRVDTWITYNVQSSYLNDQLKLISEFWQLLFLSRTFFFSECYDEERSCGDGSTDSNNSTCISEGLWCNGNVDCPNAADELSCGMLSYKQCLRNIFIFFYANANILNVFNSMEGLLWSWLYGNWIYNYLCNQCLITTYVVSSNPAQARCMYLIQHYMIKFVSDLRHVSGLLRVLRFPPPMTTMI
jgi:hypothetical protein